MTSVKFATIKQALFAHLQSDQALGAAVNGLFDEPAYGASLPYLVLGPFRVTDWSTKSFHGVRTRFSLRVFSGHKGDQEALEIADLIYARLTNADFSVSQHHLVSVTFDEAQTLREPDGVSQVLLRFSALLQAM